MSVCGCGVYVCVSQKGRMSVDGGRGGGGGRGRPSPAGPVQEGEDLGKEEREGKEENE